MPVIDPPIETIANLPTLLNAGEQAVLNYFQNKLSNAWEIFVQPPMTGLRPDFVLVHPSNGIVVVEVKD